MAIRTRLLRENDCPDPKSPAQWLLPYSWSSMPLPLSTEPILVSETVHAEEHKAASNDGIAWNRGAGARQRTSFPTVVWPSSRQRPPREEVEFDEERQLRQLGAPENETRSEPELNREIDRQATSAPALSPPRQPQQSAQPAPSTKSPRAKLVEALTQAMLEASNAGDLHTARVAHEALGQLLAEPEPNIPTQNPIADLGEVRARRSR
jgi:hypothetical protein